MIDIHFTECEVSRQPGASTNLLFMRFELIVVDTFSYT